MQWAPSAELRSAAEAACQLLHHRQEGAAAAQLQEALLSAARAAVAVCPETAACMVLALKEADHRSGDCACVSVSISEVASWSGALIMAMVEHGSQITRTG